MNYAEITDLALSYSDRNSNSAEAAKIDGFLRIVESRVKTMVVDVQKMTARAAIETFEDKAYYGLPADFVSMRDIKFVDTNGGERTIQYLPPQQMTAAKNRSILDRSQSEMYYCIVNQQLQIQPSKDGFIQIVYYRKIPALSPIDSNNWLSDDYPDCYVFGLLVEINSFVKDGEAVMLWDARFKESIAAIENEDSVGRWSGPAMQMRAM